MSKTATRSEVRATSIGLCDYTYVHKSVWIIDDMYVKKSPKVQPGTLYRGDFVRLCLDTQTKKCIKIGSEIVI